MSSQGQNKQPKDSAGPRTKPDWSLWTPYTLGRRAATATYQAAKNYSRKKRSAQRGSR